MSSEIFYNKETILLPPNKLARFTDSTSQAVRKLLEDQKWEKAFVNRATALSKDNRNFFLQVNRLSKAGQGGSSVHETGRDAIVAIVKHLVIQDKIPQEKFGVISMYCADRDALRDQFEGKKMTGVEVATVDAFQGRGKEVMFVHLVKATNSNDYSRFGSIGDPNRLNVATSRAMRCQFMVGNMDGWSAWFERGDRKEKEKRSKDHRYIKSLIDYVNREKVKLQWAILRL